MNQLFRYAAVSVLCLFVSASVARAQVDARMLQNPDVSKTQIVFSYAGDLWVVPKTGGTASKLSSPAGPELFPHFSPDGTRIAYSANYDGNMDVYNVATGGGVPVRVTYHGMPDRILDWYPDGKQLLFASAMASGRQRYSQFYRVSPDGGMPDALPVPFGEFAAISPDGKMIAYTPQSQAFRTWKRYRGGWAADIWLFDVATQKAENLTKNDADDEFPMWSGRKLYFLSDRDANERSNIWVYDLDSKQTKQVTNFTDYDVHFPAIGPEDIVFENGGALYLLSLADEKNHEVKVQVSTDQMTLMPRSVNAADLVSNIALAPDGKRAVFSARGDVFSVPAEHGNVLDLTNTPGAAERYAAWSPDAKTIAYWSDASGEYELYVRDVAKNSEKKLTSYGPGYRYRLFWSPDSKKIAFIDKAMQIKICDVASGKTTDADKELYYYQDNLDQFVPSWSPDSRWLAYRKDGRNANGAIVLFDTKDGQSHPVTTGYYNDNLPTFDPDGKYVYFLTNRNFNPTYSDLDGTWIYANTSGIAAASLTNDTPAPTAPENDSTKVDTGTGKGDDKADKKDDKSKDKKGDKDKDKKKEDEKPKETKITLEGFENRVVMLPVKPGNFANLAAVSGKVVFHRNPNTGSADETHPIGYYDLAKREEKTITDDSDAFAVSADGKKVLIGKKGSYAVVDVAEGQKMDKAMPSGTLDMTIDPRAEWKQIFNDVWRFERDFFYDPNMHGVDWNAMKTRYGKLLDNAVTRSDVNFVIGELISELSSSHTYRGGGDEEHGLDVPVGYLGCDWELANGAYRVKKIITGAAWDTEVRSPLAMPGVKVAEGDYVLAVNGRPIDATKAPWAAFAGLSNKTVTLTVNSKPSMDGAHDVLVQTLDDETRLRNLAWVESNRKHVEEMSGGKIGYIYVPSTGLDGQTELVRQFAAQFNKEGLVVDERFNSGGQIPDRFVELLNRKPLAFWAVRDGADWQFPQVANFGPKAMLINGWSGSGGDAFPDYFRKAGLGPLVGMRTWGGLIGISGSPELIDGGGVTVPTFRMYDPDGKWFKEGHGVDPDIEVPEDYTQLAKGIDVQLDRGVQEVMKQITAKGSPVPKRPAYEKR
jgi:tricorn protease